MAEKRRKSRRLRGVLVLAALVAALATGLQGSTYHQYLATMIAVNAIIALGLNLLSGYSGQLSIGHSGFVALGACTTAALLSNMDSLPWPAAILAAGVASALVGVVFAIPATRLSGPYLALVTVGFAIVTPQMLLRVPWLSGGRSGISVDHPDPPPILASHLNPERWFLLVALVVLAALYFGASELAGGRLGRRLIALRESEHGVQAAGLSLLKYKVIVFGVSAFYAGIAGGMFAIVVGFVNADSFSVFRSVEYLAMIIVGGLASVPGSVLGAAIITLMPSVLSNVSKAAPGVFYGAAIVCFALLLPNGIAPAISKWLAPLESTIRSRIKENLPWRKVAG